MKKLKYQPQTEAWGEGRSGKDMDAGSFFAGNPPRLRERGFRLLDDSLAVRAFLLILLAVLFAFPVNDGTAAPTSQQTESSTPTTPPALNRTLFSPDTQTTQDSGSQAIKDDSIHILIAEDTLPTHKLIKGGLERLKKNKPGLKIASVDGAYRGDDIVNKVREQYLETANNPDNNLKDHFKKLVIFMDMSMPGLTGVQATTEIRKIEKELNIPKEKAAYIIAFSANDDPTSADKQKVDEAFKAAGADTTEYSKTGPNTSPVGLERILLAYRRLIKNKNSCDPHVQAVPKVNETIIHDVENIVGK